MTSAHKALYSRVFDDAGHVVPASRDEAEAEAARLAVRAADAQRRGPAEARFTGSKFVYERTFEGREIVEAPSEDALRAFLEYTGLLSRAPDRRPADDAGADAGEALRSLVRPFIYQRSFDDPHAREEELIEPEPEEEPEEEPEPEPIYGEDELNAAREQAFAEGHARGKEEGMREVRASLEQASAQALERIAGVFPALQEAQIESNEATQAQAVAVAAVILRKLFPGFTDRHGTGEIEAVVRDSVRELVHEPRVIVRVHPDLLERLKEPLERIAVEGGYLGQFTVVGDEGLEPGDCRVEWGASGAERSSARLWDEIEKIVSNALGAPLAEVEASVGVPRAATELAPEAAAPETTDAAAEPEAAAGEAERAESAGAGDAPDAAGDPKAGERPGPDQV